MNRFLPLSVLAVFLLTLAPTAEAAWTTTANVPVTFRPNRDVTFTYTASSSSAADIPLAWRVTLHTCQDLDADTWCETSDGHRVDHGDRTISLVGGQSATVSWTVNLASPEGAYRYHFHTVCLNNPCTGSLQPGGANNRTGAFQLAYTNTWTRQIITTNPTSQGASQTVTYRMMSTSANDRDLAGSAELALTPPSGVVVLYHAKNYAASAGTAQDIQWTGVTFPQIGTTTLQVTDTNADATAMSVTVRGVHLHATLPRASYTEGSRFSIYITLEGHGAAPDPAGIVDDVDVVVTNGSFPLLATTLRTDAQGRAYLNFTAPHDANRLNWRATASGTWNGVSYDKIAEGYVDFTPLIRTDVNHTALEENVTAIRENLSELQLKGVHLDEVGARNVWVLALRATGAVILVVLLILLVIVIAWRI